MQSRSSEIRAIVASSISRKNDSLSESVLADTIMTAAMASGAIAVPPSLMGAYNLIKNRKHKPLSTKEYVKLGVQGPTPTTIKGKLAAPTTDIRIPKKGGKFITQTVYDPTVRDRNPLTRAGQYGKRFAGAFGRNVLPHTLFPGLGEREAELMQLDVENPLRARAALEKQRNVLKKSVKKIEQQGKAAESAASSRLQFARQLARSSSVINTRAKDNLNRAGIMTPSAAEIAAEEQKIAKELRNQGREEIKKIRDIRQTTQADVSKVQQKIAAHPQRVASVAANMPLTTSRYGRALGKGVKFGTGLAAGTLALAAYQALKDRYLAPVTDPQIPRERQSSSPPAPIQFEVKRQ